MKPGERKNVVTYLSGTFAVSITRACKVAGLPKSMFYYASIRNDQPVIDKLRELAELKPREGQDKFYDRIRGQGLSWNYKRVRRVYLLLGLNQRRRTKRRLPIRERVAIGVPEGRNVSWSMDFMHDTLMNKRKFRVLNIIDDYNRQALHIEADFSFPSIQVINALKRAIHEHGKPKKIRVDNGPEFISSTLSDWCAAENITLQYIQPGKPMQNGFIERFNRTFRQDVLDAWLFEDIYQIREEAEKWMDDYNEIRPHESLNNVPPLKYQIANLTKELPLN